MAEAGGSIGQDLRIRLLGRFRIEAGGTVVDDAPLGHLGKVALGFLATERHRSVPRDELADVIWDERPPPTWPDALRGVVSRVRTVLEAAGLPGSEALTSASGCYQLHLPVGTVVDVEQAAAALQEARDALDDERAAQAVEAAQGAVALTAGRFLPGSGGEWVERRQRALGELRLDALGVLASAAVADGRPALAADAAEEAIGLQPLRESAYLRLADAHAAAGNRAEALRTYERCRRTLAEELGVNPSPTTEAAYLRLLTDDEPTPSPADGAGRVVRRLPISITSFVGRGQAIADVQKHLRAARLLSLVGVGGVGKSRLALQVAGEATGDYAGGVWLVELAGLADEALVGPQVRAVLGAPEVRAEPAAESLARHLGAARLLLVLDNCEHLVEASAALADELLRRCPGLRILTTSREPLGVPGEVVWPVPPLTTPGAVQPHATEALLDYESVRLFVDRATAIAPDLRLDDATLAGVAAVARRLDGIPLAIELAAAWAKVLSVAEIAERLDDRFRLLVGGPRTAPARHQTLRAALDWSYESLPAAEARVLRRLSVFAGGFTLDAAEVVSRTDDPATDVDILCALSDLFDKSLVLVDRAGQPARYRQLETVRQYAADRLGERDEEVECRRRHLHWAMELAEAAASGLDGPDQERWLRALDADHDNLRAALDWAAGAGSEGETGARLAAALWRFWEIRGWLGEGRAALATSLACDDLPPPLRARLLNGAGILAQRQRDNAAARGHYQECLVIRRSLDEDLGVASALHGLANVAFLEGDLGAAAAGFEENLALARRLGVGALAAASLLNLGVVEHTRFMRHRAPRDVAGPRALAYLTESLGAYEQLGDRQGMALALENLGTTSAWLNQPDDAMRHQERSLAIRRELGDRPGIAVSARYLSRLVLRTGDCDMARGLSEECLAIERELGKPTDEAEALGFLAEVAMVERDYDEARALLEQSIALHRIRAVTPVPGWLLSALSEAAISQRDLVAARSALQELTVDARRLQHAGMLAGALSRLSLVALAEGDVAEVIGCAAEVLGDDKARTSIWVLSMLGEALAGASMSTGDACAAAGLLGAADALRGRFEPPAERPHLGPEHGCTLAAARRALGDGRCTEAWEAGAAWTREELAGRMDDLVSALSPRPPPSS